MLKGRGRVRFAGVCQNAAGASDSKVNTVGKGTSINCCVNYCVHTPQPPMLAVERATIEFEMQDSNCAEQCLLFPIGWVGGQTLLLNSPIACSDALRLLCAPT